MVAVSEFDIGISESIVLSVTLRSPSGVRAVITPRVPRLTLGQKPSEVFGRGDPVTDV
jgi:hypothetical protein